MKQFKQFQRALNFQQSMVSSSYDNGIYTDIYETGVYNIDSMPYVIKSSDVVWLIMADNSYLGYYEEDATEYGVTKNGKWAAVSDAHCSCYGWEATPSNITYYSNLDELIKCDKQAEVILKYKDALVQVYPFLKKYFPK